MIKSRLKFLMAEKDINSLSELERQLKQRKLNISRPVLQKIYHNENLHKTYIDTVLKLMDFFNCTLEELLIQVPNEK